jgi:peptidoglycan/xylan/chitin deacetylase (PgdA/CDA1 family)
MEVGLAQIGSVLALSAVGVCAYAYLAPASGVFLPSISRGRGAGVALTFDDGPTPGGTGAVLDVLARQGVSAAFFVIGGNAARWPDLVRRMHAEGHIVCNHTYDHLPLGALRPPGFWREQLRRTDEVIGSIIGERPAFFRPPLGHKSVWMRGEVRRSGKVTVSWSRRGLDGVATTADRIVGRIVPRARAGDIVLLHDGRESWSRRDPGPTVAALPRVIGGLRGRGLAFERLDRLLGLEPYLAAATRAGATGSSTG